MSRASSWARTKPSSLRTKGEAPRRWGASFVVTIRSPCRFIAGPSSRFAQTVGAALVAAITAGSLRDTRTALALRNVVRAGGDVPHNIRSRSVTGFESVCGCCGTCGTLFGVAASSSRRRQNSRFYAAGRIHSRTGVVKRNKSSGKAPGHPHRPELRRWSISRV